MYIFLIQSFQIAAWIWLTKICWQTISIKFNQKCLKEKMLPKYTHTHKKYIYIYMCVCVCVCVWVCVSVRSFCCSSCFLLLLLVVVLCIWHVLECVFLSCYLYISAELHVRLQPLLTIYLHMSIPVSVLYFVDLSLSLSLYIYIFKSVYLGRKLFRGNDVTLFIISNLIFSSLLVIFLVSGSWW